ncbi:MAG: hypothetical protein ACREN3_13410 [Gemmatimonadaceae bacterium]
MQYATASANGNPVGAVAVSGATLDQNLNGTPRLVYGANTIEHTQQTQATLQAGVQITDHVSARFTLGWWHNEAFDATRSFLRDAGGAAGIPGHDPGRRPSLDPAGQWSRTGFVRPDPCAGRRAIGRWPR